MPSEKDHVEGYITIEGSSNILDKIRNLLAKAEERVYISCTRNYLLLFVDELESLIWAKKKVVIVTDQPVNFRNARVYMGNNRGMQIGVITDSRYVLTGEYGEGSINTCLYSGQKNFVELYKSALSNEIKLLAMTRGEHAMKKKPFVTKEQLDEIIKKYPTPFHLYDEKGIRKNMQALKEAFAWNHGV